MEIKQYDFDEIKRIVARNNILTYPSFNNIFKIHTNASVFQLGAVIRQKGKPIALCGRKLTDYQKRYKLIDR